LAGPSRVGGLELAEEVGRLAEAGALIVTGALAP
jgi:hypothetical protein